MQTDPKTCGKCGRQWREHAVAEDLTVVCPGTVHDARPDDMAELARLTAIELRKRGIWARPWRTVVEVPCFGNISDRTDMPMYYPYSMGFTFFDNLGPIGCADVIQAEESRRAQEWAGDK